MRIEEAIRKIRLLRRMTPENGAFDAEAENAGKLARKLLQRFSITDEGSRATVTPSSPLHWRYWERLLAEFGITLYRFGIQGSAMINRIEGVTIVRYSGQWRVERISPDGWKIVAQSTGLDSLRMFLNKYAPQHYSVAG